jgi:hypothetical protein
MPQYTNFFRCLTQNEVDLGSLLAGLILKAMDVLESPQIFSHI